MRDAVVYWSMFFLVLNLCKAFDVGKWLYADGD